MPQKSGLKSGVVLGIANNRSMTWSRRPSEASDAPHIPVSNFSATE
jgi:hypothetical protein